MWAEGTTVSMQGDSQLFLEWGDHVSKWGSPAMQMRMANTNEDDKNQSHEHVTLCEAGKVKYTESAISSNLVFFIVTASIV